MEKNFYNIVGQKIKDSKYCIIFTGAGISVESGIPPFRGKDGIWNKYDPEFLYIDNYLNNPFSCWKVIKEIFYDYFSNIKPNKAHIVIGNLYKKGFVKTVITQNIDNLHQEGGCENVIEFHGNLNKFICLKCNKTFNIENISIEEKPPFCNYCKFPLKPDIIFFGEAIKEDAIKKSIDEINKADLLIIIGTSGEVAPANNLPFIAKRNNCFIVEINIVESIFTKTIVDIFLKEKASIAMEKIELEVT
ncbi:MAG: RNA polymerase subunit sigma [Spirochaetes bacterium]|nr:RNA polymerase subunit sigma [Spirochaetota bacterium]